MELIIKKWITEHQCNTYRPATTDEILSHPDVVALVEVADEIADELNSALEYMDYLKVVNEATKCRATLEKYAAIKAAREER